MVVTSCQSVGQSQSLRACCVPGTTLGAGGAAVNKWGRCAVGPTPSPSPALLSALRPPGCFLHHRWPVIAVCHIHAPDELTPVGVGGQGPNFQNHSSLFFPHQLPSCWGPATAVPLSPRPDAEMGPITSHSSLLVNPHSRMLPVRLSRLSSILFFLPPSPLY